MKITQRVVNTSLLILLVGGIISLVIWDSCRPVDTTKTDLQLELDSIKLVNQAKLDSMLATTDSLLDSLDASNKRLVEKEAVLRTIQRSKVRFRNIGPKFSPLPLNERQEWLRYNLDNHKKRYWYE